MKSASEAHPRDIYMHACMHTVVVQAASKKPRIVWLRFQRGRPRGIHREKNKKHELHTRRSSFVTYEE